MRPYVFLDEIPIGVYYFINQMRPETSLMRLCVFPDWPTSNR